MNCCAVGQLSMPAQSAFCDSSPQQIDQLVHRGAGYAPEVSFVILQALFCACTGSSEIFTGKCEAVEVFRVFRDRRLEFFFERFSGVDSGATVLVEQYPILETRVTDTEEMLVRFVCPTNQSFDLGSIPTVEITDDPCKVVDTQCVFE